MYSSRMFLIAPGRLCILSRKRCMNVCAMTGGGQLPQSQRLVELQGGGATPGRGSGIEISPPCFTSPSGITAGSAFDASDELSSFVPGADEAGVLAVGFVSTGSTSVGSGFVDSKSSCCFCKEAMQPLMIAAKTSFDSSGKSCLEASSHSSTEILPSLLRSMAWISGVEETMTTTAERSTRCAHICVRRSSTLFCSPVGDEPGVCCC